MIAVGCLVLGLPFVLLLGTAAQFDLVARRWNDEPLVVHDRVLDTLAMAHRDPLVAGRWRTIDGELLPEDRMPDSDLRRIEVLPRPLPPYHFSVEWMLHPIRYRGSRSGDLNVWQLVGHSRSSSRPGSAESRSAPHASVFRTSRGEELRLIRYPAFDFTVAYSMRDKRELPLEPTVLLARRPDGRPFGDLEPIWATRSTADAAEDALLIRDRSDDSLWRLDLLSNDWIHRVELPDGDRLVDTQHLISKEAARTDRTESLGTVLCGEAANYGWNGLGLEPLVPGESEVLSGDADSLRLWSLQWSDEGLTRSTLVVRRTGVSDPVLRYTYEVDEPREQLLVGLASAITAIRPPWTILASRAGLLTDAPTGAFRSLFNAPLVDRTSPLWLVLAALGASLLSGWVGITRLRRRGSPGALLTGWVVLFLLGGPLMLLVERYIEGRASRASALEPDGARSDVLVLDSR